MSNSESRSCSTTFYWFDTKTSIVDNKEWKNCICSFAFHGCKRPIKFTAGNWLLVIWFVLFYWFKHKKQCPESDDPKSKNADLEKRHFKLHYLRQFGRTNTVRALSSECMLWTPCRVQKKKQLEKKTRVCCVASSSMPGGRWLNFSEHRTTLKAGDVVMYCTDDMVVWSFHITWLPVRMAWG